MYASGSKAVSAAAPLARGRAYRATNQSLPSGSWTKIQIDTIEYDPLEDFDTDNYKYVCSVAGYYCILAGGSFEALGVNETVAAFKLQKNSTRLQQSEVLYNNIGASVVAPCMLVGCFTHLDIDDEVTFYGTQATGGSKNVIGGVGRTFLSIECTKED